MLLPKIAGPLAAISHGDQGSVTAIQEHRSCQLSDPDGYAPYTFQAGDHATEAVGRRESRPGLDQDRLIPDDMIGEGAKAPTGLPPDCDTPPARRQGRLRPQDNEHR